MQIDENSSTSIDNQNTITVSNVEAYESLVFMNNLADKQLEVRCIRLYYQSHNCFEKDKDMNTIAWYVIGEQLNKNSTVM